ncbi:ABC1 kinase family protein [Jannaschia donghaensis]|uniref:Putative ubiquinone biosynthesis protein UbiB n=1 Tax=Jannaschia donghaensis TaxID=420998 RepID=A0A0M6YGK4_9RHOB|nr:AarF/ABC1/UbiB kinase family protein [Jannaschia donghaensis]CTQ49064.1 putative ubiquinone biosynthesis protein UbiB [Jannaschia donghaensis]
MSDGTKARAIPVPAGRINRLARMGGLTAGVAGRMALGGAQALGRGERPDMRGLLLTPRNITRVTEQLAQMRGAAMKIGQLVSMDTGDILPPELAQIMARLRDDAHTMPPAQLKKVLAENWPKGWLGHFETFDVRPIAAASIGQVHRARTKDGRDLAVKVQYPGVADSIDSDVANVGALIRMSGLLPKGFELAPYLEQARLQLHEETDYALEGRHLARFGALLADDADFVVPEVQADWTTDSILAMSFVHGTPIEAAADASQDVRDRIARCLIALTLREVFDWGVMQSDPNFANYRWQADTGRIVLLDFGATRDIAPDIAARYRDLLRAGMEGAMDRAEIAAQDLGLLTPAVAAEHRARILRMMAMVFDELRDHDPFDFAATDLPRRMQREGEALARSGFVPPPVPIDVLYLQRKFAGMFLLASKLRARVDVRGLIAAHL